MEKITFLERIREVQIKSERKVNKMELTLSLQNYRPRAEGLLTPILNSEPLA
jgi:hypothetical protein